MRWAKSSGVEVTANALKRAPPISALLTHNWLRTRAMRAERNATPKAAPFTARLVTIEKIPPRTPPFAFSVVRH
jgi:hypothetical protein